MLALAACGSDDEPEPVPEPEPEPPASDAGRRTVLVYMIADNNLGSTYSYDEKDLVEMRRAVDGGCLHAGDRLLVYYNAPGTARGVAPRLMEITGGSVSDDVTLITYPDDPAIYSTDPERMRTVFDDVRRLAPAGDYGLIFWGHATGWMTESGTAKAPQFRSLGNDRGRKMAIPTLARALEGYEHSFIYIDCCLMATAEVVYELRHATPLIAASGAEVHGEGMPYDLTLPYLFAEGEADVTGAAKADFDYYDGRSGSDRWATRSVIDTSRLDALAAATRDVMAAGKLPERLRSTYQTYSPSRRYGVYDMADYITTLDVDAALISRWRAALNAAVVYHAATPNVNGTHAIKTYCGLGCNILFEAADATDNGYDNLAWWRDVVSHNPAYTTEK